MTSVNLCMIVRNEEQVLGRCLSCVKDFADEIIIVDTGSNDKTKEISSLFTDQIYDFPWIDDFAAARNFAFHFSSWSPIPVLTPAEILVAAKRMM